MTHILDALQSLRERHARLRDIARISPNDTGGFVLSRAEFTALALMPSEQIARLDEMARINGCPPERLDADRDLQVATALACVSCTKQRRCRHTLDAGPSREETGFCPNAETYRRLAAE